MGVLFDGLSGRINLGQPFGADASQDLSFSYGIWLSPNNLTDHQFLIGNANYAGGSGLGIDILSNSARFFKREAQNIVTGIITSGWHFLVGTYDKDENILIFYIDGVSQGTAPSTTADQGGTQYVGATSNSTRWFDGQIGEVFIYDVALLPAQVLTLYNSRIKYQPVYVQASDLNTYLPLDDHPNGTSGSGNTYRDMSPNDNDGTGENTLTNKAEEVLSYSPSPIYLSTGNFGGIFQSSGTAISPIISRGGEQVNWSEFSNSITEPIDSSATVEIRTSDDGMSWSGYGAVEDASDSIFAQIKITFAANTGDTQSPEVSIVKLRWALIDAIQEFPLSGMRVIKIAIADNPYTAILVPDRELVIECDTDDGDIIVNLPAILDIAGKILNVKNIGTSGNDVTLDGNGSETIEGETTQVVEDGENIKIYNEGLTWKIL